MLNQTRKTWDNIRRILLRQQKQVEEQLKSIEKSDPVVVANSEPGSSEPGTDSWMAEVHSRLTTTKNDLTDLLGRIRQSLAQLRRGTYGKCEKCGKNIEPERLKAMPTATLCVTCSKKTPKKSK